MFIVRFCPGFTELNLQITPNLKKNKCSTGILLESIVIFSHRPPLEPILRYTLTIYIGLLKIRKRFEHYLSVYYAISSTHTHTYEIMRTLNI